MNLNALRNFSVEIEADSVNQDGSRLTTFILTYPRFIHAEFMTHRAISRNAASSRAIPAHKQIAKVRENPVEPVFLGANQAGMQAMQEIPDRDMGAALEIIRSKGDAVTRWVEYLSSKPGEGLNLHKQIANRYLEPWLPITVIATATDWRNFFKLRAHPAAQPEFQVLAYNMLNSYLNHEPCQLDWGLWHMPFSARMQEYMSMPQKLKVATARCARLSYETYDGEFSLEKDYELHDRLADSKHWSPFEHCAQAAKPEKEEERSNFRGGWIPYRSFFRDQNPDLLPPTETDLQDILFSRPDWVPLLTT